MRLARLTMWGGGRGRLCLERAARRGGRLGAMRLARLTMWGGGARAAAPRKSGEERAQMEGAPCSPVGRRLRGRVLAGAVTPLRYAG